MDIVLTCILIVVFLAILCFLQAHEIDEEIKKIQKELGIVNSSICNKIYDLYNFNNVFYEDVYKIIKKNGSNTNN